MDRLGLLERKLTIREDGSNSTNSYFLVEVPTGGHLEALETRIAERAATQEAGRRKRKAANRKYERTKVTAAVSPAIPSQRSHLASEIPAPRTRGYLYLADTVERSRTLDALEVRRGSVVYFIRCRTSNLIKIGKALELQYRVTSIEKFYGPCDVLASESGAGWVERFRHHQFRRLHAPADPRVGGTEWFRPGAELLDLIASIHQGAAA
jgi:hypothetical protein